MNVGKNTTSANGNRCQIFVELLIIPYCQLNMAWKYTCLFSILGSIPSKLKNFCGNVLENGCEVDRSSWPHAFTVAALLQALRKSLHWKDKSRPLLLGTVSFTV